MKTTFSQKIDNYLEKTHGTITLLVAIGATIGALFALGMSSDYGITMPTSFGIVFFLVFFGSVLGALGAYIVAEKIGYANSAQVSRSLHKHYGNELAKVATALHCGTSEMVTQADYLTRELSRLRELAETQEQEIENLERDGVATSQKLIFARRDLATAERHRDGYRAICDTNELIKNALRETHARNERALVADLAWARELLARDGRDLVEHELADKYARDNFTA